MSQYSTWENKKGILATSALSRRILPEAVRTRYKHCYRCEGSLHTQPFTTAAESELISNALARSINSGMCVIKYYLPGHLSKVVL